MNTSFFFTIDIAEASSGIFITYAGSPCIEVNTINKCQANQMIISSKQTRSQVKVEKEVFYGNFKQRYLLLTTPSISNQPRSAIWSQLAPPNSSQSYNVLRPPRECQFNPRNVSSPMNESKIMQKSQYPTECHHQLKWRTQ